MINEARRQEAEEKRLAMEAKAKARASRPQVIVVPQPYQPLVQQRSMTCRANYLGGMNCD